MAKTTKREEAQVSMKEERGREEEKWPQSRWNRSKSQKAKKKSKPRLHRMTPMKNNLVPAYPKTPQFVPKTPSNQRGEKRAATDLPSLVISCRAEEPPKRRRLRLHGQCHPCRWDTCAVSSSARGCCSVSVCQCVSGCNAQRADERRGAQRTYMQLAWNSWPQGRLMIRSPAT